MEYDKWPGLQAIDIYQLCITKLFSKDWELKNKINGVSGSVMDNIAEGFERSGNKEFINFIDCKRFKWRSAFSTMQG